jgi:hypothetical protein
MFSNLRRRLFSGASKRPKRRRNRRAPFRGQIEQLETRTVLSASIGPLPAEMEVPVYTVVVWEVHPIDTVGLQPAMLLGVVDSYRESSRPLALDGGAKAPAISPGSQQILVPSGFTQPQRFAHVLFVEIYHLPLAQWLADGQPQPDPSNSIPAPLAAKDSLPSVPNKLHYNQSANQSTNQSLLPLRSIEPSRFAASLALPYTTDAGDARSALNSSYVARNSVLQDYGSESLLLTTISERSNDKVSDLFDDDRLDVRDQSRDSLLGLDDAESPDDVALSLDALKRERDAIDAALSQLHDLKLDSADTNQDATETAEQQNAAANRQVQEYFFPAGDEQASPSTADQDSGGMVLLVNRGDANASAYDLSAVILSGMSGETIAPLRVEASVGVYQAFDVGGSESLPAVKTAGPGAQGPAAIRTSAATQNAPANKSEQPS